MEVIVDSLELVIQPDKMPELNSLEGLVGVPIYADHSDWAKQSEGAGE